jgi:hypothetical protein
MWIYHINLTAVLSLSQEKQTVEEAEQADVNL